MFAAADGRQSLLCVGGFSVLAVLMVGGFKFQLATWERRIVG
jgi:nitrate reductase NapE component